MQKNIFIPSTRVAIYPRVSTEEQKRKGLSIEAQTNALTEWAAERKMIVVGVYNDAGNSARKKYSKRPAMLKLLEDVKADKIDLIIFTKLDRWFRNIAEYYKVQEILDEHHVSWKAIHEDYDTTTASGRLKVNIMLSVAQDEADRDSERIRDVFVSKRGRREPVTGCVPTGYIVKDKKMLKDPQWEKPIQTLFNAYLYYQSISRAREEVKEVCGVDISYQLADLILKKTAYYGYFNGTPDMCPPYITKEQYDTIQNLRKRFARNTKQKRTFLFSGIIYCGVCGYRYASGSHRYIKKDGSASETLVYKCVAKYTRAKCTNGTNIREQIVEEYLMENLEDSLSQYIASAEIENETMSDKQNYERDRAAIKRKLSRLKDLYINDMIDLDVYRKDYDKLSQELSEIPDDPEPVKRDTSRYVDIINSDWRTMYNELSRPDKALFWRKIIDKIYIYPDRSISFTILP